MAKRFHIDNEGNIKPCKAQIRCRLKNSNFEHFKDIESAQRAVDEQFENKYGSAVQPISKDSLQKVSKFSIDEEVSTEEEAEEELYDYNIALRYPGMFDEGVNEAIFDQQISDSERGGLLTTFANRSEIKTKSLMRIMASSSDNAKYVAAKTENQRYLKLAYVSDDLEVRKAAISNLNAKGEDIHRVMMMNPQDKYSENAILRVKFDGYDVSKVKEEGKDQSDQNIDPKVERINKRLDEILSFIRKQHGQNVIVNSTTKRSILSDINNTYGPEYVGYAEMYMYREDTRIRLKNFPTV